MPARDAEHPRRLQLAFGNRLEAATINFCKITGTIKAKPHYACDAGAQRQANAGAAVIEQKQQNQQGGAAAKLYVAGDRVAEQAWVGQTQCGKHQTQRKRQ